MCGIRDCGSSPRRPTNDWANRKLPRNVAVARRNLPAEVPPSRLPRLPRSASTIGRHLEQSLLTAHLPRCPPMRLVLFGPTGAGKGTYVTPWLVPVGTLGTPNVKRKPFLAVLSGVYL